MKKRSGFQVMARLIGLVKPLAGYMVLAVTMGLLGHLLACSITVLGTAGILKAADFDIPLSFPIIFLVILFAAIIRGILRYLEQACNHFIAFKLLALIRDKVFIALRKLCPAKLEGKDKGDLISVITSDIELLEVFYAHTISPVLIAVLFCAVLLVFIGSMHWLLALTALSAYVTVGIIIPLTVSKISGDDGIKFRTKSGLLSAFMLESLRGLDETQQYGGGKKRLNSIIEKSEALSDDEKRMSKTTGKNNAVTTAVVLGFDVIMLAVAGILHTKGIIEFPAVLLSTAALMSSFGPVLALAALGSTLQNTFAAGNRVLDILDEKPQVKDISDGEDIEFSGAVVNGVHFSYGEEKILDDISLSVEKGNIIGITGKSGSGKSTLLKLLMRFWETDKGCIEISDKNINTVNTSCLRDIESFVTQETHLFHDSIKNNLKIAKLDASDAEIISACKKASVHDFIMSLPDGYDTEVGELGDTLSGGERQRIGLARAFLHDAPFMLLDEPTSNLDSLNEAVILRSLKEERENRTVVLVSHRASTMKIADSVISVAGGRKS